MDPATIAMLGLGAVNTGMSIYGGMEQAKLSKGQRRKQKAVANRKYGQDLKEMGFQEEELKRKANEAVQGSNEQANDRGIYDSSIRTDGNQKIMDERDRRLAALERQKGYMAADLEDNNYMFELQGQMANAQKWMQIAQGIQGGVQGVDWSKVF